MRFAGCMRRKPEINTSRYCPYRTTSLPVPFIHVPREWRTCTVPTSNLTDVWKVPTASSTTDLCSKSPTLASTNCETAAAIMTTSTPTIAVIIYGDARKNPRANGCCAWAEASFHSTIDWGSRQAALWNDGLSPMPEGPREGWGFWGRRDCKPPPHRVGGSGECCKLP